MNRMESVNQGSVPAPSQEEGPHTSDNLTTGEKRLQLHSLNT